MQLTTGRVSVGKGETGLYLKGKMLWLFFVSFKK